MFCSVSSGCAAVCGTRLPGGCAAPSPPKATGVDLRKGTQTCYGGGVRTGTARSGFMEGERAAAGRGVLGAATLNADRKANRTGAYLFNRHRPAVSRRSLPRRARVSSTRETLAGNGRSEILTLLRHPVPGFVHRAPDVGGSFRRTRIAGKVLVGKGLLDGGFVHATGVSGDTEGDVCRRRPLGISG